MPSRKPEKTWVLVVVVLLALGLAASVVALDPLRAPVEGVIRVAAMLGYVTVFLSVLSSNFMRELTRFFGRPFVKVHHVASLTAVTALLAHAFTVAGRAGTARVFVPLLSSVDGFLSQGGRPALLLLAAAVSVAFLRKRVGKRWKTYHWFTYLAFLLGTIHALMIGGNFQHLGVRIVSGAMAAAVVLVFVLKRQRRGEALRRRRRASS